MVNHSLVHDYTPVSQAVPKWHRHIVLSLLKMSEFKKRVRGKVFPRCTHTSPSFQKRLIIIE